MQRTTEAERRALHALLFAHPGMTLADVAIELGLSEDDAEALLRMQEQKQLVRSAVDENEGCLRYVTLRASEPSAGVDSALAELETSRHAALADGRTRTRRAGVIACGRGRLLMTNGRAWRSARRNCGVCSTIHGRERPVAPELNAWQVRLRFVLSATVRRDRAWKSSPLRASIFGMPFRFVIVDPAKAPRVVAADDNTLGTLRALVGGHLVSCGRLSATIACFCDDDGESKGLPYSRTLGDNDVKGPILVTGEVPTMDGPDVASLSDEDAQRVVQIFTEHPFAITREVAERYFGR